MSCNVEEVNLEFLYTGRESAILLDQFFFMNSCFIDLRLLGCKFNPTGSISWKNLRSLCIFHGKLDEDLIENILLWSPLLETLELGECYGYKRLDITSKSLKNLVFTGYFDPNNEVDEDDDLINIIGINAPNILSLTIKGDMWLLKFLLVNVSSLVEANLDYTFMGHWEATLEETEEEILETLILNLHHVKELIIGSFCSKGRKNGEASK
ncbi:F-box/LRR-repeat protein At5g02910 [Lactuca sativa]|uniref:F-box/LRR-repeat protein At5g02910 n=1 Tax=Lactuca sativa TaxID=4236 RepID=UPI000CD95181|nr:F-box/LRR-repeat protein At5g02910 [Lactuca sativa]